MQIIPHHIPFYALPDFSIKSFAQQSNRFLISFVFYLELSDLSDAHFDGILQNKHALCWVLSTALACDSLPPGKFLSHLMVASVRRTIK
jgi:hypothetical protein